MKPKLLNEPAMARAALESPTLMNELVRQARDFLPEDDATPPHEFEPALRRLLQDIVDGKTVMGRDEDEATTAIDDRPSMYATCSAIDKFMYDRESTVEEGTIALLMVASRKTIKTGWCNREDFLRRCELIYDAVARASEVVSQGRAVEWQHRMDEILKRTPAEQAAYDRMQLAGDELTQVLVRRDVGLDDGLTLLLDIAGSTAATLNYPLRALLLTLGQAYSAGERKRASRERDASGPSAG